MYKNLIKEVWPEWNITEKMGEGTYGTVYRVEHTDDVHTVYNAVKVIALPRSVAEMTVLMSEHQSDEAVRDYIKKAVDEYVGKMKLLEPFRYNPNIVRVEDYRVIQRQDMPGWYILIRMNLVTGLNTYISKQIAYGQEDVIQLGIDICHALEICESCGIVHGDIKPENIFVSSIGCYQLGDSLIAQAMDRSKTSFTKKKLPGFLSPEQYKGEDYGITADLYSLGLVMYRILNHNRLPFQDTEAVSLTFAQKKEALDRRFNGEELPQPMDASPALSHIIQKACAFDPAVRYQTPAQMRAQLEALKAGTYVMENDPIGKAATTVAAASSTVAVGSGTAGTRTAVPARSYGRAATASGVSSGSVAGRQSKASDSSQAKKQKTPVVAAGKSKPSVWKDPVTLGIILLGILAIVAGVLMIVLATRNAGGGAQGPVSGEDSGEIQQTEQYETTEETETSQQQQQTSETAQTTGTEDSSRPTIVLTEPETTINPISISTVYDYASLAEVYSDYFLIGVAPSTADIYSEKRAALIVHEYNSLTAENAMKPDAMLDRGKCQGNPQLYNESPALDFSQADQYLAFAKAYGMKVRWHTLVWYSQTPDWFFRENYSATGKYVSRELMLKRMENYIRQIFEHCEKYYPGVVYACDVVNEPFDDSTGWHRTDSNWYKVIGEDYIYYAFLYARTYAPDDVKLYLNEYNEYIGKKRDAIYETASELKAEGLIDGIGMQSHLDVSFPDTDSYKKTLELFGKLGLEIQITELDVTVSANTEEKMAIQASYYKRLMQALVEVEEAGSADITSVTFWGVSDDSSWRGSQYPLLFDKDLQPKPAFYGVLRDDSISE